MKRFSLVLALLLVTGFATAFEIETHEVNDLATTDEPALFEVEVENTGVEESTFLLHLTEYQRSQWYIQDDRLHLGPGEKGNMSIEVHPGNDAVSQKYGFDFNVRKRLTDEVRTDSASFRVERDNDLNIVDLDKNSEYGPGDQVELDIIFRNLDSTTTDYKDINIEALDQNKSVELGPIVPGGDRMVSVDLEVPEYRAPGTEEIELSFSGRTHTDSFEIREVEDIDTEEMVRNMIFTVSERSTISNEGNTVRSYSHTVEKPSYLSPIISAQEAEETEMDNSIKYTWDFEIDPGETAEAGLRTDYWIPVTGLAVLLAGFLGLKKVTSSVSAKKTISHTEKGLDVKIEIENSSSRAYEDVVLEDFIPNIAELENHFDMAEPEVKHVESGSKLKWWINDLEPGDQRVFKYSIRPKVEVEDGVTLKPAVLKDGNKVLDKTEKVDVEFKPSE